MTADIWIVIAVIVFIIGMIIIYFVLEDYL